MKSLFCYLLLATLASMGSAPAEAADAVTSSGTDDSYLIGPGDELEVFVHRNAELSTTVPVRPDGKISTPLVEDVVAVGKTPSQLARDIEVILAEYVRSPTVNVLVKTPVSAFSQIRIVGEVKQPQAIAYREGMTVLDAILQVGGLGEFASGNRAKITRQKDGKVTEIRVRLNDLINKGDVRQNVKVLPGDILFVPKSFL